MPTKINGRTPFLVRALLMVLVLAKRGLEAPRDLLRGFDRQRIDHHQAGDFESKKVLAPAP